MRKNNILSFILAATVAFGCTITSFASESYTANDKIETTSVDMNSNVVIIDTPYEVIKRYEEDAKNQILRNTDRLRMPSYEYKLVKVGSQVAKKKKVGYAANQPSGGTVFASKGGTSVSFSIGYGVFSVSLSPGKTGGSGRYIESPYINTAV